MELLLKGSLSETLTLKDLLIAILQAEVSGLSLLELNNIENNEQTKIYFLSGLYIVGAEGIGTDQKIISGQEVLEPLMQVRKADFSYYDYSKETTLPSTVPLKVNLRELIDNWQDSKPMTESEMLDKIFDTGSISAISTRVVAAASGSLETLHPIEDIADEINTEPQTEFANSFEQSPDFTTSNNSAVNWNLMEPLVSGEDRYDNFNPTQNLRTIVSEKQWQHRFRSIMLILIMFLIAIVVILCCFWFLMNAPSSQVTPKRLYYDKNRH